MFLVALGPPPPQLGAVRKKQGRFPSPRNPAPLAVVTHPGCLQTGLCLTTSGLSRTVWGKPQKQ